MRNATGDYIGFVDGDDIVSLECARIAVKTLKSSLCNILFWKYKQFIEAKQCYEIKHQLEIIEGLTRLSAWKNCYCTI